MPKPEYNGSAMKDQATVDNAKSEGFPVVDGKQAVAHGRRHRAADPAGAVNWYMLEDGTEVVRDDAGNAAVWPEV